VVDKKAIQRAVFERLGKFRQKVVTLRIMQGMSLKATARACGCTPRKVRRVEEKWKMLCQREKAKAMAQNSASQ
jgi:DNA-directed RNA polymerase specialized sigma24 family protein